MARQLDIFEEQRKARYQEYYEWFYRGSLKRAEERRKEREAREADIFVDLDKMIVRPLTVEDLKLKPNGKKSN